jgi:multicomponent K+:H+ antiporter subunit F
VLTTVLPIVLAMIMAAAALNLWRLVAGPSAPDRILALDTLAINIIAIVLVLGIKLSSVFYFETALLIAMMGFVGTVALCKFLISGTMIE